jgi:hypothetical protein
VQQALSPCVSEYRHLCNAKETFEVSFEVAMRSKLALLLMVGKFMFLIKVHHVCHHFFFRDYLSLRSVLSLNNSKNSEMICFL